ncbi:MAG: right-handed parallel beta-helix repeat-containing protein [Luteolibacter sp.]|uniref:right-handed parallel beta-helix repeat-containing protein n=1 Tax=Luteolibacter sp. TaxID=1962973 RepID=UPI0032640574
MKTAVLLLALGVSTTFAQGPLAPPPGAPAAGMKTLTQIEPRTPIETLPFTISTSGSYYFTKNLQFTAASGDAISITTGNVTLDLNGFTLSSTAPVTGKGISTGNELSNISIKNGIIAGNTVVTISGSPRIWTPSLAGFTNGVYSSANDTRNLTVDNLQVSGCRGTGIYTALGKVTNCSAQSNGGSGINAFMGSVANSIGTSNGAFGVSAYNGSIAASTGNSNASDGINADLGSVIGSSGMNNGGSGIRASNSVVKNCLARGNASAGIWADSSVISDCKVTNSGSDGIRGANSTISTCKASSSDQNADDGYTASSIYWVGGRQVDNVSDSYVPAAPAP